MDSWDDATQPGGDFLKAEDLKSPTVRATLTKIARQEMPKLEGEGLETVFLATFAGSDKVLKLNKTNRIYLKEHCGITQENLGGFEPILLVLYPKEYRLGTAILLRLPDTAPDPDDDIPF